ncbi:hypothetical protein TR51_19735 [Kitasatospora griseola]|uniref:Aminoglycoside phosphotransferase domain-containing protein n=1 Tax=Kitasatospora griseola TaxID=2064 RepID=A0A0D0NR28_KITGR|nr:phosphotransferase [Kitasatospora griseola]KIQ61576.1 hypothetical protein TR51_19735 [Kitasatospora griseola]
MVIDGGLARRLVDAQFPHWAGLPLAAVEPGGSDHVIFRLGEELAVRLPRHADAGGQAERDEETRAAVAALDGVFDGAAMTTLWEAALGAPAWGRPPVWVHGDFHTGNLLTVDGRLGAVIDFGGLGLGDPACDLTIAFTLLEAGTRTAFRTALGVDEATWLRGRGWALATGLNAYTHYAAVNPRVAARTTRQITEALRG